MLFGYRQEQHQHRQQDECTCNGYFYSEMAMKIGAFGLAGLVLLFALSSIAHAQQNCEWRPEGPLGPAWYQPGGSGACNNNSSQSVAAPPRWASRWGAIAISSSTGHVGTSAGKISKSEAKHAAMQDCGDQDGIPDCKVNLSYSNACAAYAWGGGRAGTGSAPSTEEASARALNECSKKGKDCQLYYSECSLPERIQ
jgi:hypothetical protein